MAVGRLAVATLCLALAACSSGGGVNRIAKAAFESLKQRFERDDAAPASGGGQRLTRAAVEATGLAMIRARLVSDAAPSLLAAQSDNGGYVTYATQLNQTLTLRGALITASRGLGHDLLSVEASASDPLVRATPLDRWPSSVTRVYRFPDLRLPGGKAITVRCTYVFGDPDTVTIVEVTHQGRQVGETCRGEDVEFQNLLLADAETGFVWRSLQWLGPRQGVIDMEVIEPYEN